MPSSHFETVNKCHCCGKVKFLFPHHAVIPLLAVARQQHAVRYGSVVRC